MIRLIFLTIFFLASDVPATAASEMNVLGYPETGGGIKWPVASKFHNGLTRHENGWVKFPEALGCALILHHAATGIEVFVQRGCAATMASPLVESRLATGSGFCLIPDLDSSDIPFAHVPCDEAAGGWTAVPVEGDAWLRPGMGFLDCDDICPEMRALPVGRFMMGPSPGEEDEAGVPPQLHGLAEPRHPVTIGKRIAMSDTEIDGRLWNFCVADGGCRPYEGTSPIGHGPANPYFDVTWHGAQDYVQWLSAVTGRPYRLPTEAEWEYGARASTTTIRPWGNPIGTDQARCNGCLGDERPIGPGLVRTMPLNAFHLANMLGGVWEWVEDCYQPGYEGAPGDGSAFEVDGCERRVIRGGSWLDPPWKVRSASRAGFAADESFFDIGFRVARDLQD